MLVNSRFNIHSLISLCDENALEVKANVFHFSSMWLLSKHGNCTHTFLHKQIFILRGKTMNL